MPKGVYPRPPVPTVCKIDGCDKPRHSFPSMTFTVCEEHSNERRQGYYESNVEREAARHRAYRQAHLEEVRARGREKNKTPERLAQRRVWRTNPEVKKRERAYAQEYNQRPEIKERQKAYGRIRNQRPEVKARNRIHSQSPKSKMRKREYMQRRQGRILDVQFLIKQEMDVCGVCLLPLTSQKWPAPLATTVGHEPPLARAAKDGWLTVIERPEHWACNRRKRDLLDSELRAA